MCVALIGGTEGIDSSFRESAARAGFHLWLIDGEGIEMASRIEHLDAVVIIADKLSSRKREEALEIARSRCIPAFCTTCEGAALCGVTALN